MTEKLEEGKLDKKIVLYNEILQLRSTLKQKEFEYRSRYKRLPEEKENIFITSILIGLIISFFGIGFLLYTKGVIH